MLPPATRLEELAGHNVFRTYPNEDPALRIGEWQLHWKAQGADTGYAFSIYETTLAAGNGLPLHKHPFPEFSTSLRASSIFAAGTMPASPSR